MTIIFDDDYHEQAYAICKHMHKIDGLSYGDICEAHGLKRYMVRPNAELTTLSRVIAEVFRNQPEYGWIDESSIEARTEVFNNVVYIEKEKEALVLHGVPKGAMGAGNG